MNYLKLTVEPHKQMKRCHSRDVWGEIVPMECAKDGFCRCPKCKPALAMPTARASHEPSLLRRLGHTVTVAIAALGLAACQTSDALQAAPKSDEADRGLLRMKLFQSCMANLPAGPRTTRYNDWDEVVGACSQEAYYISNGCEKPRLCLDAIATEAGTAATENTGAVHEGAGRKASPQ